VTALREFHCVPCRGGVPPLTDAEIAALQPEAPQWQVIAPDGIARLERRFTFPDFATALAFTNRVGAIAEAEGHHPALLTEWGQVTVTWWTHKIKGLHRNDFIMAAKTDALAANADALAA
jgi:4a-hydroxytetrahydrobiopterin dehydratase